MEARDLRNRTQDAPDRLVAPEQQPQAPTYQSPELCELGSLDKLQRYGFSYNDGKRYKDDY